jgi:hypothetical protein
MNNLAFILMVAGMLTFGIMCLVTLYRLEKDNHKPSSRRHKIKKA